MVALYDIRQDPRKTITTFYIWFHINEIEHQIEEGKVYQIFYKSIDLEKKTNKEIEKQLPISMTLTP